MANPAQPAAAGQKRKRDGNRTNSNSKGKQRASDKNEPVSIAGKVHHALQLVTRAAKKARTFEIQKLVRKIKSDKAKEIAAPGTSKLHAELEEILEALKALNIEEVASQAFGLKLRKDKSGLLDNEHIKTFVDAHPAPLKTIEGTSLVGKAQNRILASKVFVQCLQEVIDSLRQKAGIATAVSKPKAIAKDKSDTAATALSEKNLEKLQARDAQQKSKAKAPKLDKDSDATSSDDDSEISGTSVSHISAEEDMPDDEFTGIAGADSEDEDEDEDSDEERQSISGASTSSFPTIPKKQKKDGKETTKASNKDTRKKEKSSRISDMAPPTTSAFLPSLAAGYTLGDSDGSVYSDEEAGDTKPERKNRRGQRARQAIWERKYGKNAKHVQKAQARDKDTEEARQKARAEAEIERKKKSGRFVYGAESNLTRPTTGIERTWAASAPTNGATTSITAAADMTSAISASTEAEKRKRDKPNPATAALHPSWEARKKAKEAQASFAAAKPAGTKIVFD